MFQDEAKPCDYGWLKSRIREVEKDGDGRAKVAVVDTHIYPEALHVWSWTSLDSWYGRESHELML